MQSINSFQNKLFQVNNQNFDEAAIDLFKFQYENNGIYQSFVNHLAIDVTQVNSLSQIPFLPISFFKTQRITCGHFDEEQVFESSGTTQQNASKHYINDLKFYHQVSSKIFSNYFGGIQDSIIIGLLPSYLERMNSSLVSMVNHFIEISDRVESGFYLDDLDALVDKLNGLKRSTYPIYLFGVTFALLELATNYRFDLSNMVVLETGGMKGRGREMIREELHFELKKAFKTNRISSEYGMTELLSQAYMDQDGFFKTPPWMKVIIRDINDPFSYVQKGRSGAINVIDLANIHSCAFIETEDLGVMSEAGFRVLGRLDNSDMRGCNLLVV